MDVLVCVDDVVAWSDTIPNTVVVNDESCDLLLLLLLLDGNNNDDNDDDLVANAGWNGNTNTNGEC